MKPTNGKASTIMIRDLSKKDNLVLKELRQDFSTEFNTVAVMKAAYNYIEQKKLLADKTSAIAVLESKIETLTEQLSIWSVAVNDYFEFEVEKEKRQAQLASTLHGLIKESKKKQPKAKVQTGKGRGLSMLID